MKNKEEKAILIDSGLYETYTNIRHELYQVGEYEEANGIFGPNGDFDPKIIEDNYQMSVDEYKMCEQLRNAKCHQRNYIKDHIDFWVKKGWVVIFVTLTLTDKSLKKSPKYIRDQVTRTLAASGLDYIANVDYSPEKHRLHYHGLLVVPEDFEIKTIAKKRKTKDGKYYTGRKVIIPGLEKWEKTMGGYDADLVRDTKEDREKVASYIAKLVNHSLKVKQTRLMIKRDSEYRALKSKENHIKNKQIELENKRTETKLKLKEERAIKTNKKENKHITEEAKEIVMDLSLVHNETFEIVPLL